MHYWLISFWLAMRHVDCYYYYVIVDVVEMMKAFHLPNKRNCMRGIVHSSRTPCLYCLPLFAQFAFWQVCYKDNSWFSILMISIS